MMRRSAMRLPTQQPAIAGLAARWVLRGAITLSAILAAVLYIALHSYNPAPSCQSLMTQALHAKGSQSQDLWDDYEILC